ncbi:cyclic diguanylate phosphodiesterase [Virgisporangium aliadipatigenens]|uniref:Cyclic diguanylate phosphodiesterase n=1 Tax=Virgisporangium aliadipatigenens TaxID=741659 RepID=A0A8J3YP93_9ACTN|nr:GAF domain-containing SpoIIE family protein phosphatase [Virgisporangium aliadipatigenens]GIJ47977.1 cyclic diguanylate phosphodiesterase [Virgisporangium aliadipatigenens]
MTDDVLHTDAGTHLRRLQAITDAALSHLGVEDLLAELLERTCDLLRADTAAVLLLDSSGTELVVTAAKGLEEEVRQGIRVPVGQGFAGTVAARAEPVAVERLHPTDVVSPVLRAKGLASMLGVPMISTGRLVGVLHVGTRTTRRFGPEDIELLRLVADRAGLAAQARTSRLDRATAVALQRSLLPDRLPSVAGLDIAARYVPGAEVGVGGDWYDLFALPSGHVGIAIGDVAGSGLHAAVVMGRIRSALRAYALETLDPGDVLTRLDRKVRLFEPDAMATAVYAVLDPARAVLNVSSAGHLPPLLVHPDRPAAPLAIRPDLPLGVDPARPRRVVTTGITAGTGLFLYTDGLVERRARLLSVGIEALLAALRPVPSDEMCASAMAALLHGHTATDDVAVLAVRTIG